MNRITGGILLIIGTCLGGAILALPLVTAAGGYWHAALLLGGMWLLMTIGAFFVLEVTLWLPPGANLISMSKATLGRIGAGVTWVSYLLLFYSLISAYTAGGADLLANLLSYLSIYLPAKLNAVLFVLLLGSIVFYGIRAVDCANRALLSVKLLAFFLLLGLISSRVDIALLPVGHSSALLFAVMPVITAFGFAIIMPSLRAYLNSDVKALRKVLALGSLFPLICYLLWDFVVQASIQTSGPTGLAQMAHSAHSVSDLTEALSRRLHSHWIDYVTHLFTSICITTSFLGVSLCLSDFLADGLHIKQTLKGRWLIMLITYLPPVLLVWFYPGAFIGALGYAGIFCIILLMLLPSAMTWSGRYIKGIATGYRVCGGKWLLSLHLLLSLFLFVFGIYQQIF